MRTSIRWALPAAVTVTIAASALVVPQLASADPELAPTTAADLLVDLATAPQQPVSGTVVQTPDLGLPELPTGPGGGSELTSLLAGRTMLRVWSDGPERSRVAVMTSLSETDIVRDWRDVWTWESEANSATHATLPEVPQGAGAPGSAREPVPTAPTPQEAAERVLAAVEPSTEVTLDGTASVAGRDAYELVIEPRTGDSLVGEVRVAVDAATSLPLRVQVTARGADEPAYETAFTSVSFDRPGDEVFRFTPPAGAEVTEQSLPVPTAGLDDAQRSAVPAPAADGMPTVVGEGWTSVVVLRGVDAAAVAEAAGGNSVAGSLLAGFQPVSGEFGSGRLLTTSLLSALWLDDGRLLVGAVGTDTLTAAASDPAAALVP